MIVTNTTDFYYRKNTIDISSSCYGYIWCTNINTNNLKRQFCIVSNYKKRNNNKRDMVFSKNQFLRIL